MHQPEPHRPEDVRPPPRSRPAVDAGPANAAVERDDEVGRLSPDQLRRRIDDLRNERDAVILAHNYQRPEIQDLADHVGDSLELSLAAANTRAARVVFCGVQFMAETAAILCPNQRVLLPDPAAQCSLAATITADELSQWQQAHPDALVVAYLNTSAEIKALADFCCTSANAVQIVKSIAPDRDVLFLPDAYLGHHVERATGRKLIFWLGACHVHAEITTDVVRHAIEEYPSAHLLLHPECAAVADLDSEFADPLLEGRLQVMGTGAMVAHVRACPIGTELIATEVGLLHRLGNDSSTHALIPVKADAECDYMKATTLAKLFLALRDDVFQITVPEDIATKARNTLQRMLAISAGAAR